MERGGKTIEGSKRNLRGRRLLLERKEQETDKDKENKRRSELGRTYTRHSIKDHYSRR